MKNLKVLPKFIIMLAPITLIIIGLLVMTNNLTKQSTESMKESLYDELYTASSNLINADRDFYQAYVAAILCAYEDESTLESNLADLDENYQQTYDRVNTALAAIQGDSRLYDQVTLNSLSGTSDTAAENSMTMKELGEQCIYYLNAWYNTEDDEDGKTYFSTSRSYLNAMEDILDQYATVELDELESSINQSVNITVIIVLILLIVIGTAVIYTLTSLTKNIKKVNRNLSKLADNDLSFEPEEVKGKDEIAQMAEAALALKEALTNAIAKVNSSAELLSDNINEVVGGINRSAEGVDNINSAVSEVADTSQQVASSAQGLNEKTLEMGDAIESITGSIDSLKEASAQIEHINREAAISMENVMNSSNQSVTAVEEITARINETNEAVARIGECVQMITEISSQTNLLSLNASIEAARAGEAGRGFAVVAEEIRQLADSSAESANEIRAIVDNVMKISNLTVDSAKQVSEVISQEQESVKDTQTKFETLSGAVEDSLASIDAIQQMSQGLDAIKVELADATSTLSAISEELGASAEEVSATCTQVAADCEMANDMSTEMDEAKDELVEAVSVFRLA